MSPPGTSEGSLEPGLVSQATPVFSPGLRTISIATGVRIAPIGIRSCFASPSSRLSGHLFPLKDSNPHFCCVLQIRRRVQQECLSVHSGSTGNCRSHQSPVQTGWLPTLRVFASHYPHISSAEKGSSCPSGRSTLYVGWVGDFLDISDERTLEATMSRETAEFHASGVFARGPAAFPNCRELPRTPSESVLFLGLSATLCKCYGLRPWEVVDVDFVVLRRLVNGSPGSSLQLLSDSHRTESPRQQHTDSGLRMISPFVEVRPITPADWDVIELHAECIEEELLLQIAVLMPGVPFPVWVRRGQRPAMLVVVTSPPPRGPMQSHEHEQTEDGKGIDLACSAASLSPASPPVCGKGHVRVTGEQRSFERAERKAFSSCREDGRIRKRTSKSACLCPAEVAPFILLGRKTELHVRPFPNSLAPLQQPRHSSITSTAHESSDYRPLREPDVREVDGDDAQHRLRSSAHSDTKGKGELQHAQQRRAVHFYMRVVPFPDAFSKSVAMSYPRPEGGTPAEPATADTADKKPDLELETLTKGQRAVMGPAFPCLNRDSDAPGESFYCLVHYCHIRSFVHQQRWLRQAPVADLLCEFQHPCALHRPEKSPAGQNEHFATAFVWISAQPVGRAKRSEQASGLALLRAFGHPDVPPGTIALSRYFRQIYRFPLCSRVCVTVCTSLPTLPRSLCLTPLCPPGGLVRISGRGQASFRSHNDDFPCSSQSHDSPADEDNQINPSLCIGKQGYGEISIEARDIGLSQFLRTRQGSKLLRHAFLDRLNHVASSTRRAIGLSFFCSSADRAAHEALSECEVPPFGLWDGMLVSVKLPAVVEHSSLVDGAFDQYENAAGRGTTGRSASTSSGSFSDQPPVPQATAAATKSHHSSARGKQDPALSQCRTESKQLTSTVENERTNRLPPRGSGGASETNQRFDRGGSREHLPSTSGSARPLACESSRHDAQSHDCSVRPILDTELAALLDNGLEDLYASTDSEGGGDHSVAHVHSLGTSRAITQTASPIKESGNGAPDPATAQEEEGPNSCPGLNCAAENGSLFTWEANVFNHVDDVSLYSEESDFESDLLLQAPSCEIQAGAAVGGNRKTGGSELTLTGPLYRREEGNGCLSSRAARCGCSGAETQTLAPSWIVLDVIISFRSRVICRVDESDCVSLPGQPQIEKQPMLRHDTALACLSELRTAIIRPATLPPSLAEAWTAASSSTDSVAALVKDSKAHRELKHMSHEQEGHGADGKMARSVQTGTPLVSAVESLLPDISGEDDFEAPYILYKDSFARQLQKGEIVCHVADPIEVSVVFSAAEAATTLTAVGRLTREEDFPRMERSAAFTPSTSCRLTFSNARGEGCCDTGSSLECSVKSLKEEHISNLSTPRWLVINAGDHGTALAQWWLYGTQQPDWELPYVSASESVGKGSLGFIEVDHEISAKPHRRQPIATMAPEMAKLMELQCVQHLAPDAIPWRDTIRFDRKCGTLVLQKGSSCWTTRPELVSFAGAARAPQDNVRWSATDGAEGAEPLYAVPTCEKPLRHGERMLSTQQSGSLGRESSSLQEPQFATVSLPKLDEEAVAHTVQGAPLATVEGDSISLLEALPLLLHSRGACPRPLSPRDFCLSVFGDTPGLLLKKILRRLGVPIASSEDCSKLGCIEAVLRRACPVAPLLPILVSGQSGSGRTELCRTTGYFLAESLGVFVLMVHCKVLATETIKYQVIESLMGAVAEIAAAHSPAVLIFDDLDAICGNVDSDAPGGPTVMDARSFQLSEFLADFLPSVSDDALLMGQLDFCASCRFPQPPTLTVTPAVFSAWDGRTNASAVHQQRTACPVPKLVVVATAVGKDHLHESLRTPALFGGDAVHLKSAGATLARVELFQHLLQSRVREDQSLHAKLLVHGQLRGATRRAILTKLLRQRGDSRDILEDVQKQPETGTVLRVHRDVWDGLDFLSQRMEGFCLADFKSVIERAAIEAGSGLCPRSDEKPSASSNSRGCSETRRGPESLQGDSHSASNDGVFASQTAAELRRVHLEKALREFVPRALQQHEFLKTDLRLSDVGGLEKAKTELLDMLTLERLYGLLLRRAGISVHKGVLLVGPPGCGKTLLATAVVGDQGMRCLGIKGPELLNKYIGSSEAAVREVFHKAQQAQPCVIFFDEIDAIATKRGGDSTGVTDRVVNQLLCYLDGVEERQEVYVIAATSRPELLDPALLRPGRLEKVCFCGLPTTSSERVHILEAATRSIHLGPDVSIAEIEKAIPWIFTPADISAVVKSAQLDAVHQLFEKGAAGLSVHTDVPLPCQQGAKPIEHKIQASGTAGDSESVKSGGGGGVRDKLSAGPSSDNACHPKKVLVNRLNLLNAIATAKPSMTLEELHRYHRLCSPLLSPADVEDIQAVEKLLTADNSRVSAPGAHTTSAAGLKNAGIQSSLSGAELPTEASGPGSPSAPGQTDKETRGRPDTIVRHVELLGHKDALSSSKHKVSEASVPRVEAATPEAIHINPNVAPPRPRTTTRDGLGVSGELREGAPEVGFSISADWEGTTADTVGTRELRTEKKLPVEPTGRDESHKASSEVLRNEDRDFEGTRHWAGIVGDGAFAVEPFSSGSREDSVACSESSHTDSSSDWGSHRDSDDPSLANSPQETLTSPNTFSAQSSTRASEGPLAASLPGHQATHRHCVENAVADPLNSAVSGEERGTGERTPADWRKLGLDRKKKQKGRGRRRSRRLMSQVALA